jgi:predicted DNA-binding ribbon-helix-helix protein
MTEMTLRMVPVGQGKRQPIRLDKHTWTAVDLLAGRRGTTWQEWCAEVVGSTPDGENATAAVRAAAMNGLLCASVLEDRGEQLAAMEQHPLMRNSASLSDRQLEDVMNGATVQGTADFGGFAISFGHDENGQDCIWVRNGLRNGLHFAFALPGGCA